MLLRVLGWVCNALYPECPPWRHMVGGVSCPSRSVALWCICVPWYSWGSLEGEWTSVRGCVLWASADTHCSQTNVAWMQGGDTGT